MNLQKLFPLYFTALCTFFFSQTVISATLENHPSPYLRMHQTDPVKWQTWGPEVLQQAQKENKPIYVSIGYFSCHWCHVMQKESYSNPDIGALLNEHYIPVKVDRELRPELDRRLIQFVEKVRGQAGWPLNVFISPEGYPITGFTYIPKNDFEQILISLHTDWSKDHATIANAAQQFFIQSEMSETQSTEVTLPDVHFSKVVDAFISQSMLIGDDLQGGFGSTSKFPSYPNINALLNIIKTNPNTDSDVVDFFHLTMNAMATKHLMDHVNFGFYRYVTDPDWQTPHFEKMLYDNAQLAALYFDAHQQWPDKGYADIAMRTIEFMNKFMSNDQGGFYASLSAVDIHNIEGGAYYYEASELKKVLNEEDYNQIKTSWKFADDDSLIQTNPLTGLGKSLDNDEQMQRILKALQAYKKDPMPVDTKSLVSWNALALKAFVRASQYSKDSTIQKQTQQLYRYLIQTFIKNGKVIKFAGQADSAETTLEDYAQLAHAVQQYANYSNDKQAEQFAKVLVGLAFKHYYVDGRWLRNTESLIPGDKGSLIIQDAVFESPVSLVLDTVFSMKKPDPKIKALSEELTKRLTKDVLDIPYYYGSSIMIRAMNQQ